MEWGDYKEQLFDFYEEHEEQTFDDADIYGVYHDDDTTEEVI